MRFSHRLLTGFALLALGACAGSTSDTSTPAPTPVAEAAPVAPPAAAEPAGFFTEAQALRGRTVFRSICSECHYSSEFSSDSFKFAWRRRDAGALYGYIADAMPEDAPGSLTTQQYLDVLSYILDMNGFPTGSDELGADVLGDISLAGMSGS